MKNRSFTRIPCTAKPGLILCTLMLWSMFLIPCAHAHKVTIFAWVDGNTIHTQSKFSKGKRVKNAPVEVSDLNGQLLVQGMTDDNGLYSFPVPAKEALKIVVKAGMGHQASWIIRKDEFMETSGEKPAPKNTDTAPFPAVKTPSSHAVAPAADTVQLKAIVEKALDKKLKPVIKMLAESQGTTSIKDIMGGLGYIFGLVGVAAYFNSRKKK